MSEEWDEFAACKGLPIEMFDPDILDAAETRAAKNLCRTCPVRQQCLDRAMKNEANVAESSRWHIYGGLTPRERATLAQQRKTT